jgi:hypothetical protein
VITPEQSTIKFYVKSSVEIEGNFDKWDATLTFKSADVSTGVLDIKIQAATVNTGSGMAAAGKEELLARRIGRDEIVAIDVCGALADAQQQYFAQKHADVKQYAQKFISDAGQQNGLYWQSPEGSPRSPLGPLVAFATEEGLAIKSGAAQPFYGYYFHRLDGQDLNAKGGAKPYVVNGKATGGFAYVAYPAEYDDTGVQTFIVNQDGVVFEKNLGKDTANTAKSMTEFNPDNTWTALR